MPHTYLHKILISLFMLQKEGAKNYEKLIIEKKVRKFLNFFLKRTIIAAQFTDNILCTFALIEKKIKSNHL